MRSTQEFYFIDEAKTRDGEGLKSFFMCIAIAYLIAFP